MSASDLAIVTALVFAWGTLSARLERFDVTAPITFVLAGLLLTHGLLAPLGYAPSPRRYGPRLAKATGCATDSEVPSLPERRLIRRAS